MAPYLEETERLVGEVFQVVAVLAGPARHIVQGPLCKLPRIRSGECRSRIHLLSPSTLAIKVRVLRLLAERREDLDHERARFLNRLHRLLRELILGGVEPGLSADKAAAALRTIRPATSIGQYVRTNFPNMKPLQAEYRALASDLVIDSMGANASNVGTAVDLIVRLILEPD